VSEPSYRITTEHAPEPQYPNIPWQARIVRISDGEPITTKYGATEAAVLEEARQAIVAMHMEPAAGGVYFASEAGELTPSEPQSLRIS
jgi:hypothetical protein